MTQKNYARHVTLHDLRTKFGLRLVRETQFFPEWQTDLAEVTALDKQLLDEVQAGFFNLIEYPPLLENRIKMAVLSPLLQRAGFFLPPFHIKSEESIQISNEDEGVIIEGRIDVLTLKDQLWVMVIESKQASFSITSGLAQLFTYMLASPNVEKPTYGMITTGGDFIFVKLVKNGTPQYGFSKAFELYNPGNDLIEVLAILKHFTQLIIEPS
jgi:hypothetical protein